MPDDVDRRSAIFLVPEPRWQLDLWLTLFVRFTCETIFELALLAQDIHEICY